MIFFTYLKWAESAIGRLKTELISNKNLLPIIWISVTLIFIIDSWITNRLNNYLTFENTIRNLVHQRSLYAYYPKFHFDANHYGPAFCLIIAPFAILPNWLGLFFWNIFNCLVLFVSLQTLPIPEKQRRLIGYIAIPCLIESMLNQQFNPIVAGMIILNFTLLNKKGGFFSSFMMTLGIFVKLYGIVGLAFFPFVKNKIQYIVFCLFWSCLFYFIPMLFSSARFIDNAYLEWFFSLAGKNAVNADGQGIDMSIMGFLRNLLGMKLGNLYFLIPGCLIFAIPYLNHMHYQRKEFQLLLLASALIFPIIFSTGAEDCTFVIAITGVGIWYTLDKNKCVKNSILPVLLIITCNFPLLLFPHYAKQHSILLSSISFIYFVVWIRIIFIWTTDKIIPVPKS